MKKRWIGIAFILLFMLSAYRAYEKGEAKEEIKKMEQIINVFNKNDIQMQQWTVYARESIHTPDPRTFIQQKVKEWSSFHWTFEPQKAIGKHETSAYTETIQFITVDHRPQLIVLYEVKGSDWNEKIERMIVKQTSQLFVKEPTFFTCAKGEFNGKMKGVLFKHVLFEQAVRLLDEFEAKPVESLNEETFVSLSAYTGQWKTSLATGNQQMNLQLALRQERLGSPMTVIVGTPIITAEY
ncbi:YwmB family TATA-box binding protein [Thermolongibacillus altinsuensis]|jgi:hypothetical protein|uniref:YwmB family TATA-box binding protein n=1 Tax=Thermolongibacillus altinsuensis TaxID=575256 RepID=UPI00242A3232|nr:YwmB family TATA-box binding protein [Thermolongibacillus altinsuensis]GMB09411.1 hypothetical protein B1no1_21210 [Thermolongibacillus altinsuensis]